MSDPTAQWEKSVTEWARSRRDVSALVQIGSRVQPDGKPDIWSDFDYQLITANPRAFQDGSFVRAIAPCLTFGTEITFGGVKKVSAVFEALVEADFVILTRWKIRVLMLFLRWPAALRWAPTIARRGVEDFRYVAGRGWKLVKGAPCWEQRYRRVRPFRPQLEEPTFQSLCGRFWTQVIWVRKKIARGEFIAAQRGLHHVLLEITLEMAEEEALLAGRKPSPEGRRAERWLSASHLEALSFTSAPTHSSLLSAVESVTRVFADVSANVARQKNWPSPPRLRYEA